MRFYTGQHTYYCGVDLHTKMMFVCVLDERRVLVALRVRIAETGRS